MLDDERVLAVLYTFRRLSVLNAVCGLLGLDAALGKCWMSVLDAVHDLAVQVPTRGLAVLNAVRGLSVLDAEHGTCWMLCSGR